MAAPQNFRSALGGFHREDVVHYLEYLNTKHQNQVNQLNAELEQLRQELEARPTEDQSQLVEQLQEQCRDLTERLETAEAAQQAAEERCALLEQAQAPQENVPEAAELDAYHRAEHIERESRMRAELVYFQLNGVVSEANSKMDTVAGEITQLADQAMRELTRLQMAVSESKHTLQDAADMIKAIRPN